MRHIKSLLCHDTCHAHPISIGIINNVTSRSAIAKCISIISIRDGDARRRFNNNTNTVMLPIDDTTIMILKLE